MTPRRFSSNTGSIYRNPDLAMWLGSFEGVPDSVGVIQPRTEQMQGRAWQRSLNRLFQWVGDVAPGVGLAVGLAVVSHALSNWIGKDLLHFEKSPFSAIPIAILLGLIIRNSIGLPSVYQAGLRLCVKTLLRIGIALLGIRLSLLAAGTIGMIALPIVLICISFTLVMVSFINRWLGLPPRLGSLIAVGTSICGVSAIVATAPIIDAEDDEVSYAVACVALFGMTAMFVYPWLSHWLFGGDSTSAGLFLGTAIHDTAQVAGAGLIYQQQYMDPNALNAAVVTKLVRNLCMIGVIPLIAVMYHNRGGGADSVNGRSPSWHSMVPLFVIGFVAMAAVRTVGDLGEHPFGLLAGNTWRDFVNQTAGAAAWCLILAMSAVGLGTGIRQVVNIGWKPLVVGVSAALLVGFVSVILISLANLMGVIA
jgi:uncharacterized integral membrane protein (TIGR00698 family)